MTSAHGKEENEEAAPQIGVTAKMIDAGVYEAPGHPLGAPLADLVTKIDIAIALESSEQCSCLGHKTSKID
jgi:hypothetical protein